MTRCATGPAGRDRRGGRGAVSRASSAGPIVVALMSMFVGCGSDEPVLLGYVPPTDKVVSEVSVTEVSSSGAVTPFAFRPAVGEVLVVYFGYTNCPDLCPTTLYAIRTARRELGELADRVDLAMVTVDPARDTADVLPAYLASFTDRYHALIPASDAELRSAEAAFRASSSVATLADGTVEVSHTTVAYVVDDSGRVVVEWPFGIDAESMANDLRLILGE